MKKAFDQTVRDLKREVNKKVLKVPGIEQKILDATSNEAWGPHGSHLSDIAQATRNYHECQMIMNIIWKRLNDTGKNWRHVYKALTVLEYLVAHGSERVIDDIKEHAYQISTLSDFQYIDSSGRDQGSNVRRKSQSLVALVNDKEKIQEVREKAIANRDKYRSTYAPGSRSPQSGGGGYGDRNDDDRREGRHRDSYEGRYRDSYDGRYGDEGRNGHGRERDWGGRDDERYGRVGDSNRDGDRYDRNSDERYGRDRYTDDDYRGGRGNDGNQFGARSRSVDRYSEEDDRYASRHSGGRVDEPSQDERRVEHKLSEQSPPPSYEAAVKDPHDQEQNGRGTANVASSVTKAYSPPAAEMSASASTHQSAPAVSASATNKEADEFDEFDPRGFAPAIPAPASGAGTDLFGDQSSSDPVNSLALVPVDYAATVEADLPANSGVGTNFVPLSSASTAFNQPNEDPFGDGPFKAAQQENFETPHTRQGFTPATSFQPTLRVVQGAAPAAPMGESALAFDFGDPLGGLTYAPALTNGHQQFTGNSPSMISEFPMAEGDGGMFSAVPPSGPSGLVPQQFPQQPAFSTNMHTPTPNAHPTHMYQMNVNYHLQSAAPSAALAPQPSTQPVNAPNPQTTPMYHLSQPASSSQPSQAALAIPTQPANSQPPKDKFETKSTVWADTLNRGLVNLNISGAKVNPLADIGVDFESINRMDKRKEKSSAAPVTSTTTMGKAMGSGSGIGRAGAGSVAAPSNPVLGAGMGMGRGMGMGMAGGAGMGMGGYGGGMSQPMGMGMNRPMNMGMGMNMGMNQGAQMRPPAQGFGMPGAGYNPMTGMGGYGTQQPYGGGYR